MATLDERLERLGAAIAAARARLSAEEGFENVEVGDLLAGINNDLETVTHDDEPAAHARYDSLEARLAEAESRIRE